MFQQVLCDWPGINPRVEKVALRCGTRAGHGKVAESPRGVIGDTQIMRGESSSLHFSLRARRHLQKKFLSAVQIPACRFTFSSPRRGKDGAARRRGNQGGRAKTHVHVHEDAESVG